MSTEQVIDAVRRNRVALGSDGKEHKLNSQIDAAEGRFLEGLIESDPSISKTLEVGCAFGLSSLHITGALTGRPDAHHTIIDPSQFIGYHGTGITSLKRAGVDFFELVEAGSELALPKLLQDHGPGQFDLIFIDGFHTFDHTLIDFFYALRLVKVGGVIVVDDCGWRSVSKVISYVSKYPCLEIVGGADSTNPVFAAARFLGRILRPLAAVLLPGWFYDHLYAMIKFPSMVAFRKIAEDDRRWDWFAAF